MLDQKPSEHPSRTAPPMVLMLGTADWNQAIATNQHYMARELASEFPVMFSESLGLRQPEFSKRDLARMARRFQIRPPADAYTREIPNGLEIVKPIILPFHVHSTRRVNVALLDRYYRAWRSHQGPRVLWTYSPLTYGFEKLADITVYHCVDLLAEFPQIDSALVLDGEAVLAAHSDLAIASSEAVYEHLRAGGFSRVEHWPNVADVSLIRKMGETASRRVAGRVVFAGNFSEKKVDFDLLSRLVDERLELHLAGPIAEGGGKARGIVNDLVRNGAVYHGHLPLPELARLYWTSTVGLIPYELNSYTLGVNPLKTYEYLAAGLKVVSTAIPAVVPDIEHVYVAKDACEFVREVMGGVSLPTPGEIESRQMIAERNSWTIRGQLVRQELNSMLKQVGGSA
jgi:glycosyltransferase involved in cell wall biosynthesis